MPVLNLCTGMPSPPFQSAPVLPCLSAVLLALIQSVSHAVISNQWPWAVSLQRPTVPHARFHGGTEREQQACEWGCLKKVSRKRWILKGHHQKGQEKGSDGACSRCCWSRKESWSGSGRKAEGDLFSHTVEFRLPVYLEIDIQMITERIEEPVSPCRKAILFCLFCFPVSSSSCCTWHRVDIQHGKNTALVESNPKDSVGWSPELCCLTGILRLLSGVEGGPRTSP